MVEYSKLANALERVRRAADQYGANILNTADISRADRELLIHTEWLREIIKGWYLLTRPDLANGDSTVWYANFWDFLRIYLKNRYDDSYCLSAEASLELQIGTTLTPKQVIVIVPTGGNVIKLPFGTSLLTYADAKNIPDQVEALNGLRVMSLPFALCRVTPTYFVENKDSIYIALRSIRATADISRTLLEHNFVRAAERIIGAYRAIGMPQHAEDIQKSLAAAGMKITEKRLLETHAMSFSSQKTYFPFVARINLLWQKHRQQIIDLFPEAPGLPQDSDAYLKAVDSIYQFDAYNSLSIEGYHVTNELIEQVKNKKWNPDKHKEDANARDALAAKGYYLAFTAVKNTLMLTMKNKSAGALIRRELPKWYQALFSPSVNAGIITAADLLGYRRDRVLIRNSRHTPPPKEVVLDAMEALFDCLENEDHACVRAVMGHYIFVFIHPYMDGNGRIARFLLNAMLASGGYPWTVVRLINRQRYIDALESVHTKGNIQPFTKLILDEMQHGVIQTNC